MIKAKAPSPAAEEHFEQWQRSKRAAIQMAGMCNELEARSGVLMHICERSIARPDVSAILKAHRHAYLVLAHELSVKETLPIMREISRRKSELAPCRIDLGRLTMEFLKRPKDVTVERFIQERLGRVLTGPRPILADPQHVVLYGFGRIGRLIARLLVLKTGRGDKLLPTAIVVRPSKFDDLNKRAALFRTDSVHGRFPGTTMIDEQERAIVADGVMMRLLYSDGPGQLDFTKYGIENAIVVDNTGKWRDREGLTLHLNSDGVDRVLLTAPGKGNIPNIVFGVNQSMLDPAERIVSAASCTTNAIVPVLKVVNDRFGIDSGHMETVHAYTPDQHLTDNLHKSPRRGRAAALNMVITDSGATSAVAKAIPGLDGKLTGSAIRVPTPDVSMAILQLRLSTSTTKGELNSVLRAAALSGRFAGQIDFTTSPDIVSTDLVGSRHAGVVDGDATIVADADGRRIVLKVWYDNEFGYACQAVRVIQYMAGINEDTFPNLP